jgi:hypothetical protein
LAHARRTHSAPQKRATLHLAHVLSLRVAPQPMQHSATKLRSPASAARRVVALELPCAAASRDRQPKQPHRLRVVPRHARPLVVEGAEEGLRFSMALHDRESPQPRGLHRVQRHDVALVEQAAQLEQALRHMPLRCRQPKRPRGLSIVPRLARAFKGEGRKAYLRAGIALRRRQPRQQPRALNYVLRDAPAMTPEESGAQLRAGASLRCCQLIEPCGLDGVLELEGEAELELASASDGGSEVLFQLWWL